MSFSTQKLFLLTLIFIIHSCNSLPTSVGKTQAEIRASLITKENFRDHFNRNKKQLQSPAIPPPFIVSTEIKIGDQADQRRGRSYPDGQGNTIVEGIRVADDPSDRMTHRNGRFINNIFVPNDAQVPSEVVVTTRQENSPRIGKMISDDFQDTGRSLNPDFREYYLRGSKPLARDSLAMESRKIDLVVPAPKLERPHVDKPVYITPEEPDSLHADRSPYDFEPADTKESSLNPEVEFFQSGIAPAKKSDFVVKEHIYTMCPGCPTFSIPIPIPVASLRQEEFQKVAESKKEEQVKQEKNIFEIMGDKIASNVKGLQDRVFDPLLKKGKSKARDESNIIAEKKGDGIEDGSKSSFMPIMFAGAAAVALGSIALLGNGPSVTTIGTSRQATNDVMTKALQAIEKYEKQ